MFATLNLLSAKRKRFSPWWLGLRLGVVAAIAVWWWLQNETEVSKTVKEKRIVLTVDEGKPVAPKKVTPQPAAKPKTLEPDDLTKIDGIGPKYARVLNEAGVTTFAQLAKIDADAIRDIFRAATGRSPDPSKWLAQASKLSTS